MAQLKDINDLDVWFPQLHVTQVSDVEIIIGDNPLLKKISTLITLWFDGRRQGNRRQWYTLTVTKVNVEIVNGSNSQLQDM